MSLDATCLRTSKEFFSIGRQLLYGENKFYFRPVDYSCFGSSPSLLHHKNKREWRPSPYKPVFDGNWNDKMNREIHNVSRQANAKALKGWV